MISLLGRQSAHRSHLSEDALTRMICRESSPVQGLFARRHLNRCRQCRARYKLLARTAHQIFDYRQNVAERLGPLPSARRDQFIRQLDLLLESVPSKPRWEQPLLQFELRPFANSVPSFTGTMILACVGLILFSAWRWQFSTVSAAEFLNRAVVSDASPSRIGASGVIRRRLRVKTRKRTIERTVYRDDSGRRQPKKITVDAEEAELAIRLALAGVNWDDPLSAVSFKDWHDRQQNPHDEVHSSGGGLLTISTRLQSTGITQESLIVRKDNFHPIGKTIEYREFGMVEISEVSVDFLSWDAASQLFYEPQPVYSPATPRGIARALIPSTAQLNETELQARLVLNQQNADTGEQIEITRDLNGLRVQGLVESEERKRELNESLRGIPFLSATIRSFDDLKSATSPSSQVAATQKRSAVAQVSPLEQYFVQHARSRDDLSRISAGLFNYSLAINRSSRSIEQIVLHFSADGDLTPAAIHSRDELLTRSLARLLNDLKEQQRLMDEARITVDSDAIAPSNPDAGSAGLVRLAERNAAATRELISGASGSDRSEKPMVAELAETISQLRTAALTFIQSSSTKR
jgi:hypothetical protein